MKRKFVTLDVFTRTRFAGNPLAVVLDCNGLDTATMQSIAREFNHPETVFVLPPDNPAHRAALRILTPAAELPFAGHPTIGTAVLLSHLDGAKAARKIVLEEQIGPVTCHCAPGNGESGHARFDLPRLPATAGAAPSVADAAAALSVSSGDIGYGAERPSRWSAGLALTFVPVRSLEAIARCRADMAQFERVFGVDGPGKVYLYTEPAAQAGNHLHARMFAPGLGIPEDPATGSAAAAFAGLIAASGRHGDGSHTVRIEQGFEMGRPSLIELSLSIGGGQLVSAAIGGDAVVMTQGTIEA
jgi:trans-2,3-dihydro-3-hydroxyanthranilate isomerase